jgi:hypothetical protein
MELIRIFILNSILEYRYSQTRKHFRTAYTIIGFPKCSFCEKCICRLYLVLCVYVTFCVVSHFCFLPQDLCSILPSPALLMLLLLLPPSPHAAAAFSTCCCCRQLCYCCRQLCYCCLQLCYCCPRLGAMSLLFYGRIPGSRQSLTHFSAQRYERLGLTSAIRKQNMEELSEQGYGYG